MKCEDDQHSLTVTVLFDGEIIELRRSLIQKRPRDRAFFENHSLFLEITLQVFYCFSSFFDGVVQVFIVGVAFVDSA